MLSMKSQAFTPQLYPKGAEQWVGAKTWPQLTVSEPGRKPEIGLSFTGPLEARRLFAMEMTYKKLD